MSNAEVVILTKPPTPGLVKTRLIPALGPAGSARLHEALVFATIELAKQSGLPITISLVGGTDHPFGRRLLDTGVAVVPQAPGDLGEKLAHALRGPGRRIALGTDCVCFDPRWLQEAAHISTPVGFGPSEDGGYWTVSVAAPLPAVFQGIPWSTARTLAASEDRARQAGLAVTRLPTCYDIDDPPLLARLAADPRCPPSVLPLLTSP